MVESAIQAFVVGVPMKWLAASLEVSALFIFCKSKEASYLKENQYQIKRIKNLSPAQYRAKSFASMNCQSFWSLYIVFSFRLLNSCYNKFIL